GERYRPVHLHQPEVAQRAEELCLGNTRRLDRKVHARHARRTPDHRVRGVDAAVEALPRETIVSRARVQAAGVGVLELVAALVAVGGQVRTELRDGEGLLAPEEVAQLGVI